LATICWYFAFDAENLDWSFILLVMAAISSYIAVLITLKRINDQAEILQVKSKGYYQQWQSKEGKWGHVPWGAGLRGALGHFLQSFKNVF